MALYHGHDVVAFAVFCLLFPNITVAAGEVSEEPRRESSPDQDEIDKDEVSTDFTAITALVVSVIVIAVASVCTYKNIKKDISQSDSSVDNSKKEPLQDTSNIESIDLKKDEIKGVDISPNGCSFVDWNDPRQQFYDILIIHQGDEQHQYDYVMKLARENHFKAISIQELPGGPSKFDLLNEMLKRCSYTILVMTSNFSKGIWAKEHYQAALAKSIENKEDSVIPFIFDKDIQIPPHLNKLSSLDISNRFHKSVFKRSIKTSIRKQREASLPERQPDTDAVDSLLKEEEAFSLPFQMVTELSALLNAEHALGANWKRLAGYELELTMNEIANIEKENDPTRKILELWEQRRKDICDLQAALKKMDRADCLIVLKKYMPSDSKQTDGDETSDDDSDDDKPSSSEVLLETLEKAPAPPAFDPNKPLLSSSWGQKFLRQGSGDGKTAEEESVSSIFDTKDDTRNCSQPPASSKKRSDMKKVPQAGYQDVAYTSLRVDGDVKLQNAELKDDIDTLLGALSTEASKKGLEVVDVPRDGSCMFHAIIHQMNGTMSDDKINEALNLRKRLVKYLEVHPKGAGGHYRNFISAPTKGQNSADTASPTYEDGVIDRVLDRSKS